MKKTYSPEEAQMRREIFVSHLASIRQHNADPSRTWKKGVNNMTDWTDEEFKQILGLKKGIVYLNKDHDSTEWQPISLDALPASVDWRNKGIITAVKNQGSCGSCWTFGTAETIESFWALAGKQLPVLSEQQIVDCTPNPNDCGGTGGCGGGTPELAYTQIIKLGGLTSETQYPYTAQDGQCYYNQTKAVAKLRGYVVLPSNHYTPVMQTVATKGPLVINVDASAWSAYESGVFTGCDPNSIDIDHVVQLVGYGTDSTGNDYWLVRNSWGAFWGESGYIRINRSSVVHCGTDSSPQDGTGCNGGPPTVTVCGECGILYDVSYPLVAA